MSENTPAVELRLLKERSGSQISPSSAIRVMQNESSASKYQNPPIDKWNIVWIILLIHGIGVLIPWNMFINAQDYFRGYKLNRTLIEAPYSNLSDSSLRPFSEDDLKLVEYYSNNFLVYIGFASQLPNLLFSAFNLLINFGSGNLRLRVNITLAIEGTVFILTILLANLNTNTWPITFFYITIALVALLNMSNGIYQNCIFGTGSKFSGGYINAVLIGSNISGTFTSVVNILSTWTSPMPQKAAIYYFVTALFVILVCLVTYNLLPFNEFYIYANRVVISRQQLVVEGIKPNGENNFNWVPESITTDTLLQSTDDSVPDGAVIVEDATLDEGNGIQRTFFQEIRFKWQVFLKCWPQCLNVFVCFFITLALFPSILADVKQSSENSLGLSERFFSSFACFLVFNLFAMVGNMISGLTTFPGRRYVWILVWLRILFIPFFLFCNFNPSQRRWPVYISSDLVYVLGNVLMAMSSGYLSSLCMMFASQGLIGEEAPKAGMIAAFFLVFGITGGVYMSLLLRNLVNIQI